MTVTYRVTVVTGTEDGSGTDANVYITLLGEKPDGTATSSGERELANSADNFEWGQVDVFNLETDDLGPLTSLVIRHNNANGRPGWYLDRIIAEDETHHSRYVFPCNRWLARDEDDGQIVRTLYEQGGERRQVRQAASIPPSGLGLSKSSNASPGREVITSDVDGAAYLIKDGQRHRIASPVSLMAAGLDPREPDSITHRTLSAAQLEQIPMAGVLPVSGSRQFDSGLVHLGANHWMRTWGSLDLGSGQIAAQTRTATFTWFGGYHGATYVIFSDRNDAPVHKTGFYRYGVDGTWIGLSDRTDAWWETVSAADARRITNHTIFLVWAPDSFQTMLDRWVDSGQKVAALVAQAAAIAAVVSG
ncbi:PLAT/LH2 domain-containing protein [Streptomyces sp. NPDC059785]|uniref:PLAT/LH2 domain-containing protein n=1 Tax=Streptomyces sp. NPDC059785 TaxID=3346945 RepID=UPI0036622192